MKDVEANADFTSKMIKEKLAQTARQQQQEETDVSTGGSTVAKDVVKPEAAETAKLWYEAQSDEGHVYYWHIETGGKYEGMRNIDICILLKLVMTAFCLHIVCCLDK
jgi:hypothetical protein